MENTLVNIGNKVVGDIIKVDKDNYRIDYISNENDDFPPFCNVTFLYNDDEIELAKKDPINNRNRDSTPLSERTCEIRAELYTGEKVRLW